MNPVDFTIYDEASGKILRYGSCPQDQVDSQVSAGEGLLLATGSFGKYVENESLADIPARPSNSHDWDWATKTWKPNLTDALEKKRIVLEQERTRRHELPITYDGASFDADKESRENIIGTRDRLIRGDGLPANWQGWRDAGNVMRWAADMPETVLSHVRALSIAIEDRKQALYLAAWQHKANLATLATVEEVLAYDVTAGWPA